MAMSRRLTLVLTLLVACGGPTPDEFSGVNVDERLSEQAAPVDLRSRDQGLFFASSKRWSGPIPVCWVENGFETEKYWVRSSVHHTWEAASGARFTGWQTCTQQQLQTSGAAVRLKFVEGRGASELGTDAAAGQVWTRLSIFTTGWCGLFIPREDCVRSSAVHEFGHVLGFEHEHMRPDAPHCPDADPYEVVNPSADWLEGDYDPQSIMNYCRTQDERRPLLSYWDVRSVRALYGTNGWATQPALFDPSFYVQRYPDLLNAFGTNYEEATIHWLTYGLPREARRGNAAFDLQYYQGRYSDLAIGYGTRYPEVANHWLTIGLPIEGRVGSLEFDVGYYKSYWNDIGQMFAGNNVGALLHWTGHGLPNEARRGSASFDVGYYRNAHYDLQLAFGSDYNALLRHWLQFGINENRSGVP